MVKGLALVLWVGLAAGCSDDRAPVPDPMAEARAALGRRDYAAARTLLRRAADAGSGEAAYELSLLLRDGKGGPAHPEGAAHFLEQSAKAGVALGQYDWGCSLWAVEHRPLFQEDAVKWFQLAAGQGVADAHAMLGVAYRDGRGVAPSAASSIEHLRAAVAGGSARGLLEMGHALEFGVGVPPDPAQARAFYRRALDAGEMDAAARLGHLLQCGLGGPRDEPAAVEIFRRGAESGNVEARYQLALALENGLGVERDPFEAAAWARVASLFGGKKHDELAAALKDRLSETDRARLAERIHALRDTYGPPRSPTEIAADELVPFALRHAHAVFDEHRESGRPGRPPTVVVDAAADAEPTSDDRYAAEARRRFPGCRYEIHFEPSPFADDVTVVRILWWPSDEPLRSPYLAGEMKWMFGATDD